MNQVLCETVAHVFFGEQKGHGDRRKARSINRSSNGRVDEKTRCVRWMALDDVFDAETMDQWFHPYQSDESGKTSPHLVSFSKTGGNKKEQVGDVLSLLLY